MEKQTTQLAAAPATALWQVARPRPSGIAPAAVPAIGAAMPAPVAGRLRRIAAGRIVTGVVALIAFPAAGYGDTHVFSGFLPARARPHPDREPSATLTRLAGLSTA